MEIEELIAGIQLFGSISHIVSQRKRPIFDVTMIYVLKIKSRPQIISLALKHIFLYAK